MPALAYFGGGGHYVAEVGESALVTISAFFGGVERAERFIASFTSRLSHFPVFYFAGSSCCDSALALGLTFRWPIGSLGLDGCIVASAACSFLAEEGLLSFEETSEAFFSGAL